MAKKAQKKQHNKKAPRPKVKKADLALDIIHLRNELQVLRSALETLQARLNELDTKIGQIARPWVTPAWPTWPHPSSPTWAPNTATCDAAEKPVYGARGSSWGAIGSEP